MKTCSRNFSLSIPAREALCKANRELSLDACSSSKWETKLQEAIPWPSQAALLVKNPPAKAGRHKRSGFHPWVGKIPWKGKMATTPVFLPEKSHGQRSLEGYCPWGCRVRHHWLDLAHTHSPTTMFSVARVGGIPGSTVWRRVTAMTWCKGISPESLSTDRGIHLRGHAHLLLREICSQYTFKWIKQLSNHKHNRIIYFPKENMGMEMQRWAFPMAQMGKESTCNAGVTGDVSSIPGSGRSIS